MCRFISRPPLGSPNSEKRLCHPPLMLSGPRAPTPPAPQPTWRQVPLPPRPHIPAVHLSPHRLLPPMGPSKTLLPLPEVLYLPPYLTLNNCLVPLKELHSQEQSFVSTAGFQLTPGSSLILRNPPATCSQSDHLKPTACTCRGVQGPQSPASCLQPTTPYPTHWLDSPCQAASLSTPDSNRPPHPTSSSRKHQAHIPLRTSATATGEGPASAFPG